MVDNCIGCLFSEDDETCLMIDDLLEKHNMNRSKRMVCSHPNSPYYKEVVNDTIICRLYIDAQEYIKMRDRKENIEEIKNNVIKKKIFGK